MRNFFRKFLCGISSRNQLARMSNWQYKDELYNAINRLDTCQFDHLIALDTTAFADNEELYDFYALLIMPTSAKFDRDLDKLLHCLRVMLTDARFACMGYMNSLGLMDSLLRRDSFIDILQVWLECSPQVLDVIAYFFKFDILYGQLCILMRQSWFIAVFDVKKMIADRNKVLRTPLGLAHHNCTERFNESADDDGEDSDDRFTNFFNSKQTKEEFEDNAG